MTNRLERAVRIGAVAGTIAGGTTITDNARNFVPEAARHVSTTDVRFNSRAAFDGLFAVKTAEAQASRAIILPGEDGGQFEVEIPSGFTPAVELRKNTQVFPKPITLEDLVRYRDFQSGLNQPLDGFPALAGYSYGDNDVSNDNETDWMRRQFPAFAWSVMTGLSVEHPEIGKLQGGDHMAVMLLILNRDRTVEKSPVRIESGFFGTGRIWDGENNIDELEKRLVAHYGDRLMNGEPTSGFTGQCDDGVNNCSTVLVVSVDRVQWGNNPDGTPRYFKRLIRAQVIDK